MRGNRFVGKCNDESDKIFNFDVEINSQAK